MQPRMRIGMRTVEGMQMAIPVKRKATEFAHMLMAHVHRGETLSTASTMAAAMLLMRRPGGSSCTDQILTIGLEPDVYFPLVAVLLLPGRDLMSLDQRIKSNNNTPFMEKPPHSHVTIV